MIKIKVAIAMLLILIIILKALPLEISQLMQPKIKEEMPLIANFVMKNNSFI